MQANDYLTLANWVDTVHWVTMLLMIICLFGFIHKKTIWIGLIGVVIWLITPFTWLLFGGCPFEVLADHLRSLGGASSEKIADPLIVSVIKNLFGITIEDNVIVTAGILISLFLVIYSIPIIIAKYSSRSVKSLNIYD